MKKTLTYIAALLFVAACTKSIKGNYGVDITTADEAIDVATLAQNLSGKDSIFATVKGKINAVCQTKGCWLSMEGADEDLTVRFKDYNSIVAPMNASGYEATIHGYAKLDTMSVSMRHELIKDSNLSDEDKAERIAKITEPSVNFRFIADGMTIH